jgi:hypothetical protein
VKLELRVAAAPRPGQPPSPTLTSRSRASWPSA